MRHPLSIVLLVLVVAFAPGCAKKEQPAETGTMGNATDRNPANGTSGTGEPAAVATGNPQAVPENSTAMNPVVPPQSQMKSSRPAEPATPAVHVQLTEYAIEMPDTLTAGTHPFTITNAGKVNHNFAIEGPGVDQR